MARSRMTKEQAEGLMVLAEEHQALYPGRARRRGAGSVQIKVGVSERMNKRERRAVRTALRFIVDAHNHFASESPPRKPALTGLRAEGLVLMLKNQDGVLPFDGGLSGLAKGKRRAYAAEAGGFIRSLRQWQEAVNGSANGTSNSHPGRRV